MVTKTVKTKRTIIYSFAYQVDEDYEDCQSLLLTSLWKHSCNAVLLRM